MEDQTSYTTHQTISAENFLLRTMKDKSIDPQDHIFHWEGVQRQINNGRVIELMDVQRNYYQKHHKTYPIEIRLVKLNNIYYLADGQHRSEMLKRFQSEADPIFTRLSVELKTYDCENNVELAISNYEIINNVYTDNPRLKKGKFLPSIPPSCGRLGGSLSSIPPSCLPATLNIPRAGISHLSSQKILPIPRGISLTLENTVWEKCKQYFGNQETPGGNAPGWCPNQLVCEIEKTNLLTRYTHLQLFDEIMRMNDLYAEKLRNKNITQYNKCYDKAQQGNHSLMLPSGTKHTLFLPYLSPKSRWVQLMFNYN